MNLQEIYNKIYAGEAVAVEFNNPQELNSLRASLGRHKRVQDLALESISDVPYAEEESLSIRRVTGPLYGKAWPAFFEIKLNPKKQLKEYKILSSSPSSFKEAEINNVSSGS